MGEQKQIKFFSQTMKMLLNILSNASKVSSGPWRLSAETQGLHEAQSSLFQNILRTLSSHGSNTMMNIEDRGKKDFSFVKF